MVLTLLDLKETIFARFHMGLNMIIEGKYCTTHRLAVKNLAGTLSILILGLNYVYIYSRLVPRIGVSCFERY